MVSSPLDKKIPSLASSQEEAPVIELLTQLLLKAEEHGASDLHLEPLAGSIRVRLRVDGLLEEVENLPKKLQEVLLSRLKIMSSSMNIAEKRLPQEGRFQFQGSKRLLNIRISTIPTVYGESVVLRLLDHSSMMLGLEELGLDQEDQRLFKRLLTQPHGLLLTVGPTGSGKTTTLYACLQKLNHPSCKIITVEDPIEYQLPGIHQVQVHQRIGRTFSATLRSLLRQSTNIMMVGEIRDWETAHISMNAALTGHLVLSTLHAKDAPSTLSRLQDIGLPAFLIASGLRAIVAQRLVRKLCPDCKIPTTFSHYEKKIAHLTEKSLNSATPKKASGCSACRGRGYQGRLGIFEILILNEALRADIEQKKTIAQLRETARQAGMKTLREDGLKKVFAGLTTLEEVMKQTML